MKHLFNRIVFRLTNEFKPLIVHTESIFLDKVWAEIKKKSFEKKVVIWYVMTPSNYKYFQVLFNLKTSKRDLSGIMRERYRWLIARGEKLELHVHLSKLMDITYSEQEKIISESIKWFEKELGFKPKEFVPGWWSYNEDTLRILKKYGLKMVKEKDYNSTHDYTWVL